MFEKGIRGEIAQAVKRYAKVDNKYMNDLYNLDEVSIYLQNVDIKKEYGCAMTQDLPRHGLLWKKAGDFTPEKIDELVKKGRRDYLLEINVEYPKELHENHNELSFFFEKLKLEGKKY